MTLGPFVSWSSSPLVVTGTELVTGHPLLQVRNTAKSIGKVNLQEITEYCK